VFPEGQQDQGEALSLAAGAEVVEEAESGEGLKVTKWPDPVG